MAAVRPTELFTVQGSGPVLSTSLIAPVTCAQVRPMPAPVAGLKPTLPVTADAGTLVIADSARITKPPAAPRWTDAGPRPAPPAPVRAPAAEGVPAPGATLPPPPPPPPPLSHAATRPLRTSAANVRALDLFW